MMEVLVRGNKIDITDAMKDYVKEKLSKLDKYTLDDDIRATVLVKSSKLYSKSRSYNSS